MLPQPFHFSFPRLHCCNYQPKQQSHKRKLQAAFRSSYEVGGPEQELLLNSRRGEFEDEKWSPSQYEALVKGGEQVVSVLEEISKLLEDMNMDEASEKIAVELAAHEVIGKRVDQMESGFMMALDYMIELADKDKHDKRKSILEVIKETVLSHLTKKCPPHVQVIGLLCRTPQKESRQELLRRVAAGGGVFQCENGTKVNLPCANLNDIANQADDLLETMETRPVIPDRKLLARLVLIRREAVCAPELLAFFFVDVGGEVYNPESNSWVEMPSGLGEGWPAKQASNKLK